MSGAPGRRANRGQGVCDFGAARQALGEHSRSVTGIVSAGYAPPEQYSTDAKKQGPWTDLYGLGATLYRCITDEDPVDSPTRLDAVHSAEADPLLPAREAGKGRYAPEVLALIDRLLMLTARDRPQSAEEALAIFGAETGADPALPSNTPRASADTPPLPAGVPKAPEAPKAPASPRSAWPRWVAGIAALAAIVVLAVGANLGWFGRDPAAYESAVRLEGEVKSLAEKLRERAQASAQERRDLEQRKRITEQSLRGAGAGNAQLQQELDAVTAELRQAEAGWAIRQRVVHESPRRTELQGLLTLGSRQVQDEMFQEGRETLQQAKDGYAALIALDEAGEALGPAEAGARDAQRAYAQRTAGYGIPDGVQATAARAALSQGEQHRSSDRVVEAKEAFERSRAAWGEALAAVEPEIARIDAERAAAQEQAAADVRARAEQLAAAERARAEQAAAEEASRREQELTAAREREEQARAAAQAHAQQLMDSLGIVMIDIPAGSFDMGSNDGNPDERPVHTVTLKAFRMSATEVTVAQFGKFVETTGYRTAAELNVRDASGCPGYKGDGVFGWRSGTSWRSVGFKQGRDHPVICMTWNDAQAFAKWLAKETGRRFQLPTESEWEYAARAGTRTEYSFGDDESLLCEFGNVGDAALKKNSKNFPAAACDDGWAFTAPVRSFRPNAFGLYDMHGNVLEWVADCYQDSYMNAAVDGGSRSSCDRGERVLRGGSWYGRPAGLRSALRYSNVEAGASYRFGFRLAEHI